MLHSQWNRILVIMVIFTALACRLFAQEKASYEDKIIGATCRGLFAIFLSVNDFDKLKADGLAKIKKMGDAKFKSKYTKVYPIIKDLPPELVQKYNIREEFTREDALYNMGLMDKKEVFRIIDVIPDQFFAKKIKEYFTKDKNIPLRNPEEDINNLWNSVLQKKNKDESGKK
jgi:hypothetical protein